MQKLNPRADYCCTLNEVVNITPIYRQRRSYTSTSRLPNTPAIDSHQVSQLRFQQQNPSVPPSVGRAGQYHVHHVSEKRPYMVRVRPRVGYRPRSTGNISKTRKKGSVRRVYQYQGYCWLCTWYIPGNSPHCGVIVSSIYRISPEG